MSARLETLDERSIVADAASPWMEPPSIAKIFSLPHQRFCGAAIHGDRIGFATLVPTAQGWMICPRGTRIMSLDGLDQCHVQEFSRLVDTFVERSELAFCGLKGPSNVDDMLTWMLFQKIETTLQMNRAMGVDLVPAATIEQWQRHTAPVLPPVTTPMSEASKRLFREATAAAAFLGSRRRWDA